MVSAEAEPHAFARDDGAFAVDDGGVADGADGEDGGLRRIDDGRELVNAVSTEIRNGDGAASEFVRGKFLIFGAGGHVFDGFADFQQGLFLGLFDDGSDEAVFDSDGDTEANGFVFDDGVTIPSRIDGGNCSGGADDGLEDEVVEGVFVAAVFFRCGIELAAEVHERFCIDVDLQIEVRDLRFRSEEALGDDVAHGRGRHAFVLWTDDRTNGGGGGSGLAPCPAAAFGSGFDIGANDASARSGAFEAGEIDAEFIGDFACERRGFDADVAGGTGGGAAAGRRSFGEET